MIFSPWMVLDPSLDASAETPLYRQLSGYLQGKIREGLLRPGDRLPPTRDLAGQLGLNRTTVSAAYDLLHADGLIESRGARGSFVRPPAASGWNRVLTPSICRSTLPPAAGVIDFTTSRPSSTLFPLNSFRDSCEQVLRSSALGHLLQLGSPRGYEPLRQYLLNQARREGTAHSGDDILITSGCQQALDLLRRALVRPGDTVLIEEPVYPGLRNSLEEAGAHLIGVPVGRDGIDLNALESVIPGAKLLIVTPSFQNPTGATIPSANREALLRIAQSQGTVVIENGIYSGLNYSGELLQPLKTFSADVILLGSFSKMAFPGLRVGWMIAPRPVIDRATELKLVTDLHTDQLSQAFLLHFADTGQLRDHCVRAIAAGMEKLRTLSAAAEKHLYGCRWTLPAGGMNLWVELPEGLDAEAVRLNARQAGIDFLPGSYFAIQRSLRHALRLSFIGLEPEQISRGIEILGQLLDGLTARTMNSANVPALV